MSNFVGQQFIKKRRAAHQITRDQNCRNICAADGTTSIAAPPHHPPHHRPPTPKPRPPLARPPAHPWSSHCCPPCGQLRCQLRLRAVVRSIFAPSVSPHHVALLSPVWIGHYPLAPRHAAGLAPRQVPLISSSPTPLLAPAQVAFTAPSQGPSLAPRQQRLLDAPNDYLRTPPVRLWSYSDAPSS